MSADKVNTADLGSETAKHNDSLLEDTLHQQVEEGAGADMDSQRELTATILGSRRSNIEPYPNLKSQEDEEVQAPRQQIIMPHLLPKQSENGEGIDHFKKMFSFSRRVLLDNLCSSAQSGIREL